MTDEIKQFAQQHGLNEVFSGKAFAGASVLASAIVGTAELAYDFTGVTIRLWVAGICICLGLLIWWREFKDIKANLPTPAIVATILACMAMDVLYTVSRGEAQNTRERVETVSASVLVLPSLDLELQGGFNRPPYRPSPPRFNENGGFYETRVYEKADGRRTGRIIWMEQVQDSRSRAW